MAGAWLGEREWAGEKDRESGRYVGGVDEEAGGGGESY